MVISPKFLLYLSFQMNINTNHPCLKLNIIIYQMDLQFMNFGIDFETSTYSLISFIFCVLALFVLVYYIRRRYKLYKEIKRIPRNLLILENYKSHIKNLKLKCTINNIIIIMLMIEIAQNVLQFIYFFPAWMIDFLEDCPLYIELQYSSTLLLLPIRYSFVPVLSMMMDFLWLAYRKYEYKYTIIRWTWYIVIRALVIFLIQYSSFANLIPLDYQTLYEWFTDFPLLIFPIIDLIQFVYYARRFYLQLRSREKEIKLFYFDKKAYLDSKYIRIHFKIATILVGIALFFYTLASSDIIFTILNDISYYSFSIPVYQLLYGIFLTISYNFFDCFTTFLFLISEVLFMLNYLYIFIVVVYKSYKDRKKLENINDYIRPIVKKYHDRYYNRYTNYA